MNIVILDSGTVTRGDISLDRFEKYGNVTVYDYSENADIRERVKDADVILCNKTLMTEHNLSDAKNLKFIGLFATGYNNVELEYTNKNNIVVSNAGSYSTNAVAQHVFAMLLANYNKVAEYDDFVKKGGWMKTKWFSPFGPMQEVMDKTIGIIGFGSIGQKVAEIAKAFDMKVLAYNRSNKEYPGVDFVSVDELLKNSDIVTIHCPLNAESDKMCNAEFFSMMKKGAYFINTSRGGVVDEDALYEALESEHLSGAALDVLTYEPMREDCRLINAKNITITPHAAWAPRETRLRLLDIVENNLKAFLDGNPTNVVS